MPFEAPAEVTPFIWGRGGDDGTSIFADASGGNRAFTQAFSSTPGSSYGGNPGALVGSFAVGGPLGRTGQSSTSAARWGAYNRHAAVTWTNGFDYPATDYVLEAWILPLGTGAAVYHPTNYGQIAGYGNGRLVFRTVYDPGNAEDNIPDSVSIRLLAGGADVTEPVPVSRTTWTHIAAVNEGGQLTFYVNGEPQGDAIEYAEPTTGASFYVGGNHDAWHPFNGFIDEVRFSTFEEGQFELADLLLIPPSGPVIAVQPVGAQVWQGGTVRLEVDDLRRGEPEFQWIAGAEADEIKIRLPDQTGRDLVIPNADATAAGAYSVELKENDIPVTSDYVIVEVVPEDGEKTGAYRSAVEAESSLLAYFPADGSTGAVAANTKRAALSAKLAANSGFDGRTDRSFGKQALHFKGPLFGGSHVTLPGRDELENPGGPGNLEEIAANIAALQALRFQTEDGSALEGTVEALVFISPGSPAVGEATIYSVAGTSQETGALELSFAIQAEFNGASLHFKTPSAILTWPVPQSLRGRLVHVAFALTAESVTAYADGQSLGAQDRPEFGPYGELPVNIGSAGANAGGLVHYPWDGAIDELAVYGSALPGSAIAQHYSRYQFGAKLAPPVIDALTHDTFTFSIGDGIGRQLDPASVQVTRGGSPIVFTHSKEGSVTTFTFQAAEWGSFFPGGANTFDFVYEDNTGEDYAFTRSAAVPPYTLLPASLSQPAGSAGASGFSSRVFQTLPTGNAGYLGIWEVAEGVLDGVAGPPFSPDGNLADLTDAVDGRFHLDVIDLEQTGSPAGSFDGDVLIPGIPGITGSDEYFVFEALTWVHFPAAGFYTLGVQSDDGFRVNYGHSGVPGLEIVTPASAAKAVAVTPSTSYYTAAPVGADYPDPPITGKLVLADPVLADTALLNAEAINGNIAVVDRGVNTFLDKAQRVQAAGAIGILVINNAANQGIIAPISTGVAGSAVSIPYGHVSYSDGEALKDLIASTPDGVHVRFGVETHRVISQSDTVANTTFRVLVGQPGLYPLRLALVEITGGAHVEWFSVDEQGVRHLINDPNDPLALNAYASLGATGPEPGIQVGQAAGGQVIIEFTGVLQSSPDLRTPFVDVNGATSPYTVPAGSPGVLFFRSRR